MEEIESMLYHNKESGITMTVNQRPDGSRAMVVTLLNNK